MGRGKKGVTPIKEWHVIIDPLAKKQILAITDLRIRGDIEEHIDGLRYEPDIQGKPLNGNLKGYHSIRAGSKRYRLVYKMKANIVTVTVVSVGIRREGDKNDVYAQMAKRVRLGLFDDV